MWDRKVQPGQNMKRMPAKAYNKFIDAAKYVESLSPTVVTPTITEESIFFDVQNVSIGGDIPEKSVVGLGDLIIDYDQNAAEYNDTLSFDVEIPEVGTHDHRWGVITDPISASDEWGVVKVSGPARVKINVITASHKYATFDGSTTEYMVSTNDPSKAPILWKQSGTGVKEGVVFVRPFVFSMIDAVASNLSGFSGSQSLSAGNNTFTGDWVTFEDSKSITLSNATILSDTQMQFYVEEYGDYNTDYVYSMLITVELAGDDEVPQASFTIATNEAVGTPTGRLVRPKVSIKGFVHRSFNLTEVTKYRIVSVVGSNSAITANVSLYAQPTFYFVSSDAF